MSSSPQVLKCGLKCPKPAACIKARACLAESKEKQGGDSGKDATSKD